MGKTGILGGTFDPIHYGHLITARSVLETRKMDKIIFIPAAVSPFKIKEKSAHAHHRINMVAAATLYDPLFEYSDIEIRRGDISYTIDTIRELKKKYTDLELIIGTDHLLRFDEWKQPDEILSMVTLVVMKRVTDEEPESALYYDRAIITSTPTIEISSTDIRERIKADKPVNYLLPYDVQKYIKDHNLYR